MKRGICALLSVFFGCMFWVVFDAERPPHELFTLDKRTLLGLTAWCCVWASLAVGRYAFSSNNRG